MNTHHSTHPSLGVSAYLSIVAMYVKPKHNAEEMSEGLLRIEMSNSIGHRGATVTRPVSTFGKLTPERAIRLLHVFICRGNIWE